MSAGSQRAAAALGIVVRSDPYGARSGREKIDLPLIFASLDVPLMVFFVGNGLLHISAGQAPEKIASAAYTRAWASLAAISERVEYYVDAERLERLGSDQQALLVRAQPLSRSDIGSKMRRCGSLLHV